jgi:hypothetical protein
MSRLVLPKELVKLHADLPRKSMRRLTILQQTFGCSTSGRSIRRLPLMCRRGRFRLKWRPSPQHIR